jgi:hypothetical protein
MLVAATRPSRTLTTTPSCRAETEPDSHLSQPFRLRRSAQGRRELPRSLGADGRRDGRPPARRPPADVLARLAPRGLASSRGVCRSWRAVIDGRRLLRADLLLLSLGGIFLQVTTAPFPPLFSRPWTGPATGGDLDGFFGADDNRLLQTDMRGHCNGLLLLEEAVVNPATGEWARLAEPPPPPLPEFYYQPCLAFDPAVSPHYEVFSLPEVPNPTRTTLSPLLQQSEWPPSPFVLHVFSSRTEQWEERTFAREGHGGHPMATVADVQSHDLFDNDYHCSTFWRGRLYVQCQNRFVLR